MTKMNWEIKRPKNECEYVNVSNDTSYFNCKDGFINPKWGSIRSNLECNHTEEYQTYCKHKPGE